jgi:hypothetical protein
MPYVITKTGIFIGTPEEFAEHGDCDQPFLDSTNMRDNDIALLTGQPLQPTYSKITSSVRLSDDSVISAKPKVRGAQDVKIAKKAAAMINRVSVGQQNLGGKKIKGKKGKLNPGVKGKADPFEVAEHLIKINDPSVLDEIGFVNHRVQEFEPQVFIDRVAVVPDLNWLAMIAFKIVNSAYSRGIGISDFISSSASLISRPYLTYLTICMDLYRALVGEISIFSKMPVWYWYVRNALTPRVWKGRRDYYWDMDGKPDIETWLLSLPPYATYNSSADFGLAIPNGIEDGDGYAILDAGSSTGWTLEMFQDIGVSVVSTMVAAMCMNQSEVQLTQDTGAITPTTAAFCQLYPVINEANLSTAVISAKDSIRPWHHWLAELRLAESTGGISVGKQYVTGHSGPVVFGYIVQYGLDPWENVSFLIKPKQISLSQIILAMLSMFLQADIINNEVPPHGSLSQTPSSLLLGFGASDFLQYVASFVTKRFSQFNTVYFGMPLLQDNIYLAGGSDQTYLPYDALGFPLPTELVENMARVVAFELPTSSNGKFVEVRLPILVGIGGVEFNGNPLDLVSATVSVASVVNLMYPNVTVGTYVYGAAYSSKYPLTFAATNYSKFFGSVPAASRQQVGSILSFSSQNFPLTSALANVEDIDETMLYYTAVVQPYSGDSTSFDYACTLTVHSVVNKYAFDPRHAINDIRICPIAVFPKVDMSEYTVTFDETKSLDMDTLLGLIAVLFEVNVSNIYSGYPGEQFEHTRSTIVQCRGGGFLMKLGRIAGRVFQAAPSIFDAIKGIFSGPGADESIEHMSQVVKSMARISHRNPYNPIFRVVPNPTGAVHKSGQRVRV